MTAKARTSRRSRRGQSLAEVMVGISVAALIALSALGGAFSMLRGSHARDSADNGLQVSQNAVINLETLASYDPNFLGSLKAGQKITFPVSQATVNGTSTTVTATIVSINTKPDSSSHALANVTISWPLPNGNSQTAVIPVMPIATQESACNPSAGIVTDCIGAGG